MTEDKTGSPSNSDKQPTRSATNSFGDAAIQYIFTLLPFIVYVLVFLAQGKLTSLFRIPEWSFATTVLIGQTVLALLAYPYGHSDRYTYRRITLSQFLVTAAIVFLLVPTGIVLAIILFEGSETLVSFYILQLLLFLAATVSYFVVAWVSPGNIRYRHYLLSVGIRGQIRSIMKGMLRGDEHTDSRKDGREL